MERPRIWRACLLWALLAVPALTADRLGMDEPCAGWQQVAGLVVLGGAVGVARRWPLAAFGMAAVLSLVATPALFSVSYGPALGVFALLLGLRAARVRPAGVVFGIVGCLGTARIALVGVDPAPEWVVLTGTLLFGCVFPWLGGRYWRQGRRLSEAGWTRAARLEGEQRIAEERARLRERARIAQDMHDSLGHELSLIALRAGALQVASDLPDHHRTAAADLRVAAADATERLHRIIGVLREEDEPVPLTPPGETVEQLVARAAESGLPVRWEPTQDGTATRRPAGEVAERVLYRVVREALTNAARHAPGAEVTVTATREAGGTTVTVAGGRGASPAPSPSAPSSAPSSSGGTGLQALHAAVTAVGGDFEAGPYGGGFRVRAYVPEQAAATPLRSAPYAPFARARRRVAVAFVAAVGAGVVLVGGAFSWYAYTETHSVLSPAVYAELRLGASGGDLAPVLPDRTVRDAPVERAPVPPPAGSDCRYYRASGELLVSVDHFRLCFDNAGRLVAKDVIPRAGLSQRPPSDEEFVR
ncbi:Histidine kinase-, DNA gyrase B-, and HSP90-like ATPase [Streptomyces sp. cf386]|uniref:sensor histidine kinase n=1 Tax=Streptomyces sp. cf386 TaxID=1761904 RepID=UPI000881BC79|nr:histidine kinase [Streptomyces sp. cf386]SDO48791.1 Histidine kinase-, DNA gyrase B-, and HSP90-like ATPase [Streptomyces sp. cf386]